MRSISLFGSKIVLALCNCFLLICGFLLSIGGMLVLFDSEKLMVSKLLTVGHMSTMPHPFLYYVSIAVSLLGLVIAATGILGCWASCLHSYCLLSFYFVTILFLLIGECAVYTVAWAWPTCVGVGLDAAELARTLQRNYGAAGQQQFTSSVDLAQTVFKCCGVDSANEYDTSLWRLQAPNPTLAVPLSCCRLTNERYPKAYQSPEPENLQLCQALERPRHLGFRHVIGCRDALEHWYRLHYVVFLAVGLVVILIEFAVLLSTILTCTRVYHHNRLEAEPEGAEPDHQSQVTFRRRREPTEGAASYSNETYSVPHQKGAGPGETRPVGA